MLGYCQVVIQVATFPPNVKYTEIFTELQREARDGKAGLWGLPADTAPAPSVPVPPATPNPAPPATPDSASPTSAVAIISVDLVAEVAVIGNRGTKEVNLAGWALLSETGNQRFVFPQGTVLPAGGSLKVVSGSGAAAGPGMVLWTRGNIWNNDGDPAALYDAAGGLVSRWIQ